MSEGKVVATGPGRRNLQNGETIPVSVSEGQTVLLPEYGGTTVKLGEKECVYIQTCTQHHNHGSLFISHAFVSPFLKPLKEYACLYTGLNSSESGFTF